MKTLVSVEGHRLAIEDSFGIAKNELGLDHSETRSWHGCHRHVSLVMLAFARMAVTDSAQTAHRLASELLGARMLVGYFGSVPIVFAVPKANTKVLPFLNQFIEEAKKAVNLPT